MNSVPPSLTEVAAKASVDSAEILATAGERGRILALPYAGVVHPAEAFRLLGQGAARLVDVRTQPEWEFVGHVEGSTLIEWRPYGSSTPDPRFVEKLATGCPRTEVLLFLCRSGVRSHHAAAAAAVAGFTHAYNILEGFEGDRDGQGRRGNLGGWRHAGLPWSQG